MKLLRNDEKGFSLIEVVVVASMITFLSVVLVLNFRTGGTRTALRQVAQQVASDIRRTQTLSLSSSEFRGKNRCGYGLYYVDPNTYGIYVGPDSRANACDAEDRNYELGKDDVYLGISLLNDRIQFVGSFEDVFFEPPDPVTYINNSRNLQNSLVINLGIVGGTCPDDCKQVIVTGAGVVKVQ